MNDTPPLKSDPDLLRGRKKSVITYIMRYLFVVDILQVRSIMKEREYDGSPDIGR